MIAVFATFFAAFAGSLAIAMNASRVRAWWDRQGAEMLERDLQLAKMGMVRGRGSPPIHRSSYSPIQVGQGADDPPIIMRPTPPEPPMRRLRTSAAYREIGSPAPRFSAPLLASMEQSVLDTPISEWIAEAERIEAARFRAQHGPEDAPPRPAWPVEWCDPCEAWMPLSSVASHGHTAQEVMSMPWMPVVVCPTCHGHGGPCCCDAVFEEGSMEPVAWVPQRPPPPPPPPRDAGHKSWV